MGPSGTGKTVIAEALAKGTGYNCLGMNPGKIQDKWVGSSERNLEKMLEAVKAMAPCIVVIDEIDVCVVPGQPA